MRLIMARMIARGKQNSLTGPFYGCSMDMAPGKKARETRFAIIFEDQKFHTELAACQPLNSRQIHRQPLRAIAQIDFQTDVTALPDERRRFDGTSSQR